jgi:hypothetical protein
MQFGQWDGTYNRIQSSARDFLLISTDATNLIFSTNTTERVRITSGGNVGIGSSSPAYKLDVKGTEARIGTSGAYASLYLAGDGTTTGGFLYSDYYQTILSSVPALPLIFRTTNTERMRITSGGNVGIGTSFPNGKLEVTSSTSIPSAIFSGGNVGIGFTAPAANALLLMVTRIIKIKFHYSFHRF